MARPKVASYLTAQPTGTKCAMGQIINLLAKAPKTAAPDSRECSAMPLCWRLPGPDASSNQLNGLQLGLSLTMEQAARIPRRLPDDTDLGIGP